MKNIIILLCFVAMAACAERRETTTQSRVINNELDSMCYCLDAFDDTFGLGDTVAETDDGSDALDAWDAMLKCDTIHISYSRGVFSVLAHEMLLVINAQLACDPNDQTVVEFNNRWRSFLLKSCDMADDDF